MKKFLSFIEDFYDDSWNIFMEMSMKAKFFTVLLIVLEIVVPIIGVAMGWMNNFVALAIGFLGSLDVSIFIEKIFFDKD